MPPTRAYDFGVEDVAQAGRENLDESEDEDIAHYNASLFRPMKPW